MVFPFTTQVRLVVIVVCLGAAGGLGYRLGTRTAADARIDALEQQLESANASAKKARRRADAEAERAAVAQAERDRVARKVRGLDREFKAMPPGPCDDWSADQLRLLEREREVYRAEHAARAGNVQRSVPGDARDEP